MPGIDRAHIFCVALLQFLSHILQRTQPAPET
jgi:hypothetical protein